VSARYRAAARLLRGSGDYLSIKPPALQLSEELLAEVFEAGRSEGIPIHLDSLGHRWAESTWSLLEDLVRRGSYAMVGCTLPGRWRRSLDDARRAIELGLSARVVKGEWQDPDDPGRDPSSGFLELIDRLAGRARHVGVATHDPELLVRTLDRLLGAGTSCELELLYGLPARRPLEVARRLGVPARIYVGYGRGYLPYVVGKAIERPWLIWWLLKDVCAGAARRRRVPAGV